MNLLLLDDVVNEWQQDSTFDEVLLDESALQISRLHSKYLDYNTRFKKQQRLLRRKKSEFPVADRRGSEEFAALEDLLAQQQDGIDATIEILKGIQQMGFNVSSAIKWRMFTRGVDAL